MVKPGDKMTEVGVIPEDWKVTQIGNLKPFVTSGSRGWATYYSDKGSPFIRITNLSRDCIDINLEDVRFVNLTSNDSEAARTQLRDGDVLISITADIGIIGHVSEKVPTPSYINQHIALVRFDPKQTSPRFVSYFLASEKPQKLFRALTDSGAKAGMNLKTIQQLRLALPPTQAEQEAIAEALSDVDSLIDSLHKLIAKKKAIKQGAMQELLTGKKRLPGFSGKWVRIAIGDERYTQVNSENLISSTPPDYIFSYIALENVYNGQLLGTQTFQYASCPSRARRVIHQNDVLFGTVRPNLYSHLFIEHECNNTICSTGFCVITCSSETLNSRFLYFKLFTEEINSMRNPPALPGDQ